MKFCVWISVISIEFCAIASFGEGKKFPTQILFMFKLKVTLENFV